MNKSAKKLGKNTIIYFIGNFGSKILSLILVPIYSRYINPEPLGVYDLIITTMALLQPIVLFQLSDGVFRWLISEQDDSNKSVYIKTASKVILLNSLVAISILFVVNIFITIPYFWYIFAFIITNTIYPFLQQVSRGLGKTKLYSFVGLGVSIGLFIFAILFVAVFKMSVSGLLLAQILSEVIGITLLLTVQIKVLFKVFKAKPSKVIRRDLLRYSIPLIPNTISWWIINASDRYVVTSFLGSYSNGLLSMASKFPSMMTVVTSIFNLAWQESAITTSNEKEKETFYSNIFNKYIRFLFSAGIILIPLTRIIIEKMVDSSYLESWHYSSILYIATIFGALSSFLGVAYVSAKKTFGSLITTLIAALINLLIDFVLIHFIGLYAAVLSTLASYVVLFIVRLIHTKKYMKLKMDYVIFALCTGLVVSSAIITNYCTFEDCLKLVIIGIFFAIIFNKEFISDAFSLLNNKSNTHIK